MTEANSSAEALRRSLAALKDMRERLDRLERAAHEPIAIIGAGCRLPGGVDSTEAYWQLLSDGVDAVGRAPEHRWDIESLFDPDPATNDGLYTDQGGFLAGRIEDFDAAFFGISRREAESLDPQQRLLLEVAWEALEDAGAAPDGLAGSRTGVFVGMGTNDYANLQLRLSDPAERAAYFGTGVAPSVAAGRLSYLLGLRGPALAVDTACSSSLVAVALAVQSLRSGACTLALAGGVNLMLDPHASELLCRTRALSPSGRCRGFSAAADGYVRGEGCGLVVLKRLSDAEVAGDRIMAVIRGAAVNHDGRSSGLTVPNGTAQREVIETALADAGLDPSDVDVVEAHATGTEFGDPIELRALHAVYGRDRPAASPLRVGSAKSNLGHLEAAAGVAGLLKIALALQHDELPAHLHLDEPSPHVDWASVAIEVNADARPWPPSTRPRRAGVSAFSFSGTNAHLIVEEAPDAAAAGRSGETRPQVITLSAASEPALRDLASRFSAYLESGRPSLVDVGWTTQTGRAGLSHRLAVVADTTGAAADLLRAWLAGEPIGGVVVGRVAPAPPKVAFVFSGENARYPGMGRRLVEREPELRNVIEECERILGGEVSVPLRELLAGEEASAALDDPALGAVATFALEYGLAALWRSWGIEPSVVAGQSVGEVVAACVAGVLSLEDALRLVRRGSVAVSDATFRPPALPFVSSVGGATEPSAIGDLDHWTKVLSSATGFADAASALLVTGAARFVELGAQPMLLTTLRDLGAPEEGLLPSLRPGVDDDRQIATALAGLWAAGCRPRWSGVHLDRPAKVSAPTYPFQRERYWFELEGPGPLVAPDRRDRPAPRPAGSDAPQPTVHAAPPSDRGLAERFATLPAGERAEAMETLVRDRIVSLTGLKPEAVRPELGLVELGLDSMMIVELSKQLTGALGVAVNTSEIIEEPSIAGLVEMLSSLVERRADTRKAIDPARPSRPADPALARPGPRDALASIPRRATGQLAEASSAQQRLLFLEAFDPGHAVFNLPLVLRLTGPLQVDALAAAFGEIVRRHEVLRTDFVSVDGSMLQQIRDPSPFPLSCEDLRTVPEEQRAALIEESVHAELSRPFDLADGLKLRARLLRTGDDTHLLVTTIHHVVSDGWSVTRMIRELSELYSASIRGATPTLPELPIQYADYAAWQLERLGSGEIEEQLGYWRGQLAGCQALDLPTDHPRPAIRTYRGSAVNFSVPDELMDAVRQVSRATGVTPFVTLLAGYAAVLARWSGQDDIVIGSAAANRARPETADLIGLFMNTLALRVRVDPSASFSSLLAVVRQTALGAFANQDVPFDRIVEAINPARDLSRAAIYQSMFVFNNMPIPSAELEGLVVDPVAVERDAVESELSMTLNQTATGTTGGLEFSTDLFDLETAQRFVTHWQSFLGEAVRSPSTPVGLIDMLAAPERAVLLADWNDTTVEFDRSVRVHELFARRVGVSPDVVAVRMGGEELTYRELDERSSRVAWHLRSLGVGAEEYVGVAVERSPAMLVALLGVLKAGGAYLPLDPGFPAERLEFMVADSGCRVVVGAGSPPVFDASGVTVVDLVADAAAIGACPVEPVDAGGDLAYIIYTSGSTGVPKGVEIEHRNVVNFLESMAREPGMTAGDVVLAVTTLSFDISVLELFLPLVTGATVVIASREEAGDGWALGELIASSGATVVQATPTTWRMLLESGWAGASGLKVLCGGEAMSRDLADRLVERCGSVWNMFGPTETTIWSTVFEVKAGQVGPVPIGRPIDNTVCRILGGAGQLVPVGVPGELFIGGEGVARGYRNRPELNAERFVADPYRAGSRLYRTGDMARWRSDGTIEFLGRGDHQVKVRGYRIELGEIEHALGTHPGVKAAVVSTWEASPGDVRLVGYYLPLDDDPLDTAELRDHLVTTLPAYMIPSAFVAMAAFPLTPNNKIDRKQLPPPTTTTPTIRERRPPQTPLQAELIDIWAHVLGHHDIGIDDDFFDLGGHSLLATRVFAALERTTGQRLPLSSLFQAPTIASFTELLEHGQPESRWTSLVPVETRGPRPPFFYVAPFSVTVLSFAHLARHMGSDQPFYILQPQGMEGDHEVHRTIEDMAAHYIAEMQEAQPVGPYHIGGHCSGSWVAFEMAQQLDAAGEKVGSLTLVDYGPPGAVRERVKPVRHVTSRIAHYWRDGRLFSAVWWQIGVLRERFIVRRLGSEEDRRVAELRHAHSEAHGRYVGGVWRGDAVLVRTQESVELPDRRWHLQWTERIQGELRIEVVPGHHTGLVLPVSTAPLAQAIRATIDAASAEGDALTRTR